MFNIRLGQIDIWSPECPKRTGIKGKATLAVLLATKRDGPFHVAAHDGDGESATVNGADVWDFKTNNWAREDQDDGSVTPWEDLAEAGRPVLGVSDVELSEEEHEALVDARVTEANERVEAAEGLAEATAKAAQESEIASAAESAELKARISELEAEVAELLEAEPEADAEDTPPAA